MIDDLAGIASIYELVLAPCPGCGEAHTVTLSRLGRFAYRCGRFNLSGAVEDFLRTRSRFEATRHPGAAALTPEGDPIMATPQTPTQTPTPPTPPPPSPTPPSSPTPPTAPTPRPETDPDGEAPLGVPTGAGAGATAGVGGGSPARGA